MRKLPTASALQRAMACPVSELLPHVHSTSEYAERGSAVHAFIEAARKIGRERALADVDDSVHDLCAALPLDAMPAGGDYEVKLAWDWKSDTARILPGDDKRGYEASTQHAFCGTADYIGKDGDAVVVVDWKTGHKSLGPARQSWQLRMLALAASRLTGLSNARVAYFFLREDGTAAPAWATFDAIDLAETADALEAYARKVDGNRAVDESELTPVEGEHCDYCPAFDSCPAKMNLARQIGNNEALLSLASVEHKLEAMTDAQLGEVYDKVDSFYTVADRVKEKIRARATRRDVPLGDGRVLGTVQWPWTSVNATVAYEIVTAMHGQEIADRMVPRSATLTAIKKLGPETLEAIEKRGGVVTGKKPQVRAHKKEKSK